MPTLKQLINRYILFVTIILIILSTMMVSCIQLLITRNQVHNEAVLAISQIEHIMKENEEELNQVISDYRQTCLLNAKVISHLIELSPDILHDVDELQELAKHLEIDEIHIFDETGTIFAGTVPSYFGYDMDSGEQIQFFKPLLTDKSLEMIQPITSNTLGNEMMQYSALWSKNGNYIIQVGMKLVSISKITEKNEISHIFSLFGVNPNVSYYAINSDTLEIEGSTKMQDVGLPCSQIGFDANAFADTEIESHLEINGVHSYCVAKKIDSTYIVYVVPSKALYQETPIVVGFIFLCMLAIALTLLTSFNGYMKNHVVDKIQKVNHQLTSITNGNLNQVVDVRNIYEFSELSTHINRMVQNLLSSNKKLTYIFSKNNFFVGTYEYAQDSNSVQFSEYIPVLFNLDESTLNSFACDSAQFKDFLKNLDTNAVPNEKNVYEIGRKYIRIDEMVDNNYVLGVVIDVTEDVSKRQKLAFEINLDSLTGLYNQSGFEEQLAKLFDNPENLGYYACFTIMSDNLISINEMYGRNNGDRYIKEIANLISDFGIKESIACRKGGGEFILFIYGYETEAALSKAISLLSYIQHHSVAHLDNGTDIPIDFSFGYSVYNGSDSISYEQLLKESNEKTFNNISV